MVGKQNDGEPAGPARADGERPEPEEEEKEKEEKEKEKDKDRKRSTEQEDLRELWLTHERMKDRVLRLSGPSRQEHELAILDLGQETNALTAIII